MGASLSFSYCHGIFLYYRYIGRKDKGRKRGEKPVGLSSLKSFCYNSFHILNQYLDKTTAYNILSVFAELGSFINYLTQGGKNSKPFEKAKDPLISFPLLCFLDYSHCHCSPPFPSTYDANY